MLLWFHNSKHVMIYKIKHVNKYHNGSTTWLSKNQILTRAYILNHGEDQLKCLLKFQVTNTHMQSQVKSHESEFYIKHRARTFSN
jgi:hypothetical protein